MPGVARALMLEFRPYRKWLVIAGLLGAVVAVAEVALVFSLASLASALVGGTGAGSVGLKSLSPRGLAGLAIGAAIARGILDLAQTRLQISAGQAYEIRSRKALMGAFIDAQWSVQSSKEAGEIGGAFWAYLNTSKGAFRQLVQVPGLFASFLIMLAGSFVAGGWWALGILVGTALLALGFKPFNAIAHRASDEGRRASKQFALVVYEVPRTRLESRVFGVDGQFRSRVDQAIVDNAETAAGVERATGTLSSLYTSAVYLVAVLGLGVLTLVDIAGPARYAAVILLLYRGLSYGRGLQGSYQSLVTALPALEELEVQRDQFRDGAMRTGGVPLTEPIERVEFVGAGYVYPNGHRALTDASVVFERGQAIGIVGPSGAGKSTLAQLLLGLRDPSEGSVLVDGTDLRSIDLSTWFGRIAVVAQDPMCFNDSIAGNVRCYRDEVTREGIISSLKQAKVYDELSAGPDGIDTMTGGSGVRLSGGQRQRLAIARALAGHPEVVLMDEPTSALDPITEEALRETLEYLRERTILVVIAHRFSTLKMCDRILVVNNGRIEASGSRSEVEADNTFYAEAARLARLA
jgi:ATP-binding cassette subfamily B protein